jgi:DNA repair exonuclease SbcCD nuclease subunit
MSQFFNKVACFTDIHFGNKNNSRQHNDDCERFIYWFIEQAKAAGCETCIFLGDWHHHRSSVNVSTLNYTVPNIKRLSEAFENVYMIMGNHDLYYREKREIHSVPYADLHENVHIINDNMIERDGVTLVPWLVEEEWKKMTKLKSRYVFGHFELPNFKMNAMVTMPDHGGLKAEDFTGPEYVFSGHFHKRQYNKNVHYLGSPFAHNYADAWDDERGMMILEWDGEPQYINWPDGPKYRTLPLSKLIDNPDYYLSENTYCRVTLDVPISYEEANFIKETFAKQYKLREIALMPAKKEEHATDWKTDNEIEVENVDQIVYNQLKAVDSDMINSKMLMDIYANL